MFRKTLEKLFSLVRTSRTVQVTFSLIVLVLIGTVSYYCVANTVTIQADGRTVKITSLGKTVGQVLGHSGLDVFPEDLVVPSRETAITKGLKVQITRSLPVHLDVDGQVIEARTPAPTVGQALTDLSDRFGLHFKGTDEVNMTRTEPVTAGLNLEVRRSVPVHIKADGKQWDTEIAPRTVAEALKKLNISLGDKDKISLDSGHLLQASDVISIVRVTERTETMRSDIPYQMVAQAADFPVGLPDRIISRGSNGMQEQTVKLTLEDGVEVNREVLTQRVVKPPANQVVSRGAQTSISRGGTIINFKRAYLMKATAYSQPGGITATGTPVHWGIVAVDPKVIPLGSKLYVDGYGTATALDTGGAIRGNKIDVYMDSPQAAADWGVRTVIVYQQ